jgi:hypothetical protein
VINVELVKYISGPRNWHAVSLGFPNSENQQNKSSNLISLSM